MENSIKYMTMDITESGVYRDVITAMQGDNHSRFIHATILNDGTPFSLNNIFPVIRGTKPDGKTVFNDCSKIGDVVVVELTSQMLAVPGIGIYEIALYDQTQIGQEIPYEECNAIATFPFNIHVVKSNFDATDMISTDEFKLIERVVANLPFLANLDEVADFLVLLDEINGRLGNHTIRSDVPENALFTDTRYTFEFDSVEGNLNVFSSDGNSFVIRIEYATDAGTVSGHTVQADVPYNAVFTDTNTTYTLGSDVLNGKITITDNLGNVQEVLVPSATDAHTVNGHTVESDVPSDAVFTDTTYSNVTTEEDGLMSSDDKIKLNEIESGAEVNQYAFSNIVVGATTIESDSTTDTFELAAGNNITLTPDALNKRVVISSSGGGGGSTNIHVDTTAHWNAQPTLIGQEGDIYIYTDKSTVNGVVIPAAKIGDGNSYLIDNPFIDASAQDLYEHINNSTVHITSEERTSWNNKVTCFISQGNNETLVFTND